MTDTRTAEPMTQPDTPKPAESVNADRAAAEADMRGREATAEPRSTKQVSTADLARDRGDGRAAAREAEPRVHRSNMPEPKAAPLFSDVAAGELRERWTDVQAGFVDEPKSAVEEADALVAEVMKARGYPVQDFEQRAADISVDHPHVVANYRAAHDIAVKRSAGKADTEDMRAAFIGYRSLFDELLHERTAEPAH